MRVCNSCGMEKSEGDFGFSKREKDGRMRRCKDCHNKKSKAYYEAHPDKVKQIRDKSYSKIYGSPALYFRERILKRNYGLTLADYDRMFKEQGGACRLCGAVAGNEDSLDVDHDHLTGKVRGLLCHKCNKALGLIKDSLAWIDMARQYLSN